MVQTHSVGRDTWSAARAAPSTLLFLAANAIPEQRLALDEEWRAIHDKIRGARCHDQLKFCSRWAVRSDDLLQALSEENPTILHFSGHGTGEPGLSFQSDDGGIERVTAAAITAVMRAAGASVKVVVLNACFSEIQAQALVAVVPCVIGVRHEIGDKAALAYAASFYRALAFGRSVANAHLHGVAALSLLAANQRMRDGGVTDATSPVAAPTLLTRSDIDAEQVYVVRGRGEPVPLYIPVDEPSDRSYFALVLKAKLSQVDAELIARITAELRDCSRDYSLEIVYVDEGSVRLTIEALPRSARTLTRLRDSDQLTHVVGFEISDLIELYTAEVPSCFPRLGPLGGAGRYEPMRPARWERSRRAYMLPEAAAPPLSYMPRGTPPPALPDVRRLRPNDRAVATPAFWMAALGRAHMLRELPEPLRFQGTSDPLHGAADAIQRLREDLATCVMGFHAVLAIREAEPLADYPGWNVWDVDVPLTLFTTRDRAFTGVDVAVQFHHDGPGGLQIRKIEPEPPMRSVATIHMASYLEASMSFAASQAASIPLPARLADLGDPGDLGHGRANVTTVHHVASALGIELGADAIDFEVQRPCRDAAILGGGRAVWRLDRPDKPHALHLDAAALSVQVAVAPDAGTVTAYGAAIASTSAQWLSAALPSLGDHLRAVLGDPFLTRQPIECRAEWKHLFDRG